jgi:hypothetical protein
LAAGEELAGDDRPSAESGASLGVIDRAACGSAAVERPAVAALAPWSDEPQPVPNVATRSSVPVRQAMHLSSSDPGI